MEDSKKQVVSMLTNDRAAKTTLFTATGEIIELRFDGPYDIAKITEFLAPRLTGTSAVEINLTDFVKLKTAFNVDELASAGIEMTQVINGKTVQGIFYPSVSAVEVTVGPDKVVIPHVDNLQAHMARAASDGSPSVINFFKRLAPIIQARRHSGEDLMKFIKRSEMPLTNSGRIIAYKRVTSADGEYVVDTHSRKIRQRVGSRVTMPVDMVDPSRHHSCSTGLHVANLGYLGGFSGDKTMIVLVDPENFIAVPHGEDTKARVSSYDIIGLMSAGSHHTVNQGSHISEDVDFEQLIVKAVEGTTIQPFEEVFVGHKEITRVDLLEPKAPEAPLKSKVQTTGKSLEEDPKEEEKRLKDVAKTVRAAKGNDQMPEDVMKAFTLLMHNKSKTEVARQLDTSTRSIGRWMDKFDYEGFKNAAKDAPEPVEQAETPAPVESKSDLVVDKPLTNAQIAQNLFKSGDYGPLWTFKKAKKKSWEALGFTSAEIDIIMSNKE
jgi:hypothetical protein